MPYKYPRSHRHVKRMFSTELRNLKSPVAQIHNRLLHAINLVTQHHGIFLTRISRKIIQHYTPHSLLCRINRKTFTFQQFHNIASLLHINPINTVFSTKSSLVNLSIRRRSSNTAQINPFHPESIRTAEYRTYIVQTPYIIQNNHKRNLVGSLKLTARQPVHFKNRKFSHNTKQP